MSNKETNTTVVSDPKERAKLKQMLVTMTHYMQRVDDEREGLKDTINEAATVFSLDKKVIRKLAKTMYKSDYQDVQEENQHFEFLYESLVGIKSNDLPPDEDEEEDEE